MLSTLNTIIVSVTVGVIGVIFLYALGSKALLQVILAQKQQLADGTMILTFVLPKKVKKLQLKIGQQILIKTSKSQKTIGIQFTPIQDNEGSFKILIVPSLHQKSNEKDDQLLQNLKAMNINQKAYVRIAKNNFQYLGASFIKVTNASKQVLVKSYKNVYILAQGNKIPIVHQILKGICQDKKLAKPDVTILFVGGNIGDFVLKKQFEQLEENNDNVSYYYSIPVKGERQPSIIGMGISSEKVTQSFSSDVDKTFCILCAEQNDLCVTVERALLNLKVPSTQIYKY